MKQKKTSLKETLAKGLVAAALLTLLGIFAWPMGVQTFIADYVHGDNAFIATITAKMAKKFPPINPEWTLPSAPLTAALDPFYGPFMIKSYTVIALTSFAFVGLIIGRDAISNRDGTWNGPKRNKSIEGGARLEKSKSAIKKVTLAWGGETPTESIGLVVGHFSNQFRIVPFKNAQLFGSVGSGKSRKILIPTCANLIAGSVNLIVLDPKDELRFHLEPYARSRGYRVLALSFSDPVRSPETYNPFSRAIALAKDEDDPYNIDEIIAIVANIASFICPDSPSSSNSYWTESGRTVIEGLCLYVILNPDIEDDCKNLNTVNALLTIMDEETGTTPLMRIREISRTLPISHPAKAKLSQLAGAPSETAESVISTITAKLNEYVDSRISKILWKSSFELDQLEDDKTILFVSFSTAHGNYSGVTSTLVTQVITRLMELANEHGGRLRNDVYLIFEELAQTAKLSRLATDSNLFRSCGLHMLIVLQERSLLLAKNYSEAEVRSLLSCADDTLVLSVNDYYSAEEFSKRIGYYYAETKSDSQSRSSNGSGFFHGSTSSGQSTGVQRIPLLPPEDILAWDNNINGNLLLGKHGTFAIQSPDLSQTFLAKLLGRDYDEAETNRQRAQEALERPLLNLRPAPIWLPAPQVDGAEAEPDECQFDTPPSTTPTISSTYNPLKIH